MLFQSVTFATLLSAAAAANEYFSLHVKGERIDAPISVGETNFVFSVNYGSAGEFQLSEPDGYLTTNSGLYLRDSPDGVQAVEDKSDASSPWGFDEGKLRLGPSTNWWACSMNSTNADGEPQYLIRSFNRAGSDCYPVNVLQAPPVPAPAPSSSNTTTTPEPTPEPSSSSTTTVPDVSTTDSVTDGDDTTKTETDTSSTFVTVTSCEPDVTDCPVRTSSEPVNPSSLSTYEGAALKAASGAGAFVIAAAALLV